ncbi:MAG TPA: peptidoglycan-binding protein [Acidimicrobiales bacterium]
MSADRNPRRWAIASGLASFALVAGGAVVAVRSIDGDPAEARDGDGSDRSGVGATAEVTTRDLEEHEELSGTLGFGDPLDVTLNGQGTITALPDLGTVVDRGQGLVEVDGRWVQLWFGDRPLWRTLDAGAEDGIDIQQVEENLVALGIVTTDELTVDQNWTSATTAAVKEWQESQGREETGTLAPGDVIMLPGAVRVADHPVAVGGPASGPVLQVTSPDRQVTIDLEATKQSLVAKDQAVEIELPGGTVVSGRIAAVGTVATNPDDGDPLNPGTPTIEVTVALDDPSQAGTLDSAPVAVLLTTSAATDVLAVPVDALLALAEGGYAVERVADDGTTELVAVETGAFADGWVEVTGDLAEGDTVVVPG